MYLPLMEMLVCLNPLLIMVCCWEETRNCG